MFKDPFSFNGRIGRAEYAISLILFIVLYFFSITILFRSGRIGFFIGAPLNIFLIWFILASGARRCHDMGKSGWWQAIPYYVLWMLLQPGETNTIPNSGNLKEPTREIHLPTQEQREFDDADGPPV